MGNYSSGVYQINTPSLPPPFISNAMSSYFPLLSQVVSRVPAPPRGPLSLMSTPRCLPASLSRGRDSQGFAGRDSLRTCFILGIYTSDGLESINRFITEHVDVAGGRIKDGDSSVCRESRSGSPSHRLGFASWF